MERPQLWYHRLDEHEHCVIQSRPELHCARHVFGKCHNPRWHEHEMGRMDDPLGWKWSNGVSFVNGFYIRVVKYTAHHQILNYFHTENQMAGRPRLWYFRLNKHDRPLYSVTNNWYVYLVKRPKDGSIKLETIWWDHTRRNSEWCQGR